MSTGGCGLAPTGVGGWTLFGAVPAVLALTAGGVLWTATQQLRRAWALRTAATRSACQARARRAGPFHAGDGQAGRRRQAGRDRVLAVRQ